jgi:hypothetical protein
MKIADGLIYLLPVGQLYQNFGGWDVVGEGSLQTNAADIFLLEQFRTTET